MITGELKNKVDKLWEMFWTGGLTNPLDVIEQITYLMFIRDLDSTDQIRQKEALMLDLPYSGIFANNENYRWTVFRDKPAPQMYNLVQQGVFQFIKELHGDKNSTYAKYMGDAIFKIPTPQLLEKIIQAIDELYDSFTTYADARGDLYEYLLSKLTTSGTNGQFRTPRHIIRMMVELLDINPNDTIADPACGTSGFLVQSAIYLKEAFAERYLTDEQAKRHFNNNAFTGYDMDRTMLRIGAMNMMLHGIENPRIEYKDSLSDQNTDAGIYTKILANPPFKGSLDADIVSTGLLKMVNTKKTELLFIALFLRMLKTGGRCASIVPDGVLFGSNKAYKTLRQELVERNRLEAIISMPSGVFKPYAGVSTAVIIFTKTGAGGTDKIWFYDMQSDGYSLDDKRTDLNTGGDIADIVRRFKDLNGEVDRKRTDQSFLVPKQEIVDNDYDLSINKYKQTIVEKIEYPPTSVIMVELFELEEQIVASLKELEAMLGE